MEMSDKHGPRMAEDLDKDTRAGHEELRELRTPDTDRTDVAAPEGFPDEDAVERRAELARAIEPSTFPARPAELLASAQRAFAPDWVLDALRRLPDRLYENTQQVWQALGGEVEEARA